MPISTGIFSLDERGDMNGHGLNGRGPVWWVPLGRNDSRNYQEKPDEIRTIELNVYRQKRLKQMIEMKGVKMKKDTLS